MSIIFQHIVRDTGGLVPFNVDTGPITGGIDNQGLITNSSGEVEAVLDGTIHHYTAGLPYDIDGRLCITGDLPSYLDQAIPFASNGCVSIGGDGSADYINEGIGYKLGGGLVSTEPVVGDLPGQVQNLVLTTPVDNQITASWDSVVAVPAVDSYTVEYKESSSGVWTSVNVGLVLTYDITSLLSGVSYDVRVYATNTQGDGSPSAQMSATPTGVPEQVQNLQLTAGIESIAATWDTTTANPALQGYDVQYSVTGVGSWTEIEVGVVNSLTIFGLTGGTTYDVRVRGRNASGDGAFSSIEMATPTAISASKVVELNELGFSSGPVQVLNTGTGGSAWDFTSQGGPGNISPNAHKSKNCWQSNGQRSLLIGAGPAPIISQPATVVWCGIPFTLDGNNRLIWSSSFQVSDQSAFISGTSMFAGVAFNGIAMDTTSTEWLVIATFNQALSNIRVIKNDGFTDVTSFGDTGGSDIRPEALCWDFPESVGRDLPAQVFEFRVYNGGLSASETDSLIGEIKQKWFLGVPG